MVTQGSLPLQVVQESLGVLVTFHWGFWWPWIEGLRLREGDPTNYQNFQRLAEMLEPIVQVAEKAAAEEQAAESS